MKIKNYYTHFPAVQSISEIERVLVAFGANRIMKDYKGDSSVRSLVFSYQGIVYKLPANVEKVFVVITKGRHIKSKDSEKRQAERIAWRVLRDWIHIQLSLIEIGQAEWQQVLLPYAFNGEKTLYEIVTERKMGIAELLTDSSKNKEIVEEVNP